MLVWFKNVVFVEMITVFKENLEWFKKKKKYHRLAALRTLVIFFFASNNYSCTYTTMVKRVKEAMAKVMKKGNCFNS